MSKVARLRGLSIGDLIMLAQLVACCAVVAVALRITSWRRVSHAIGSASQSRWLRSWPMPHLRYSVEALAELAGMASIAGRRNRCLVRSMLLLWLLRARGEAAEVVLGVRKHNGNFEAHAWTISDHGLVGERPEAIAEFQTLMTSGAIERA